MKQGKIEGKTQILLIRDKIEQIIHAGHTYKQAYVLLSNEGKISMTYQNFVLLLRKFKIRKLPGRLFSSLLLPRSQSALPKPAGPTANQHSGSASPLPPSSGFEGVRMVRSRDRQLI